MLPLSSFSSFYDASATPIAASLVAVALVALAFLSRRTSTDPSSDKSKKLRTIHTLPDSWPLVGDLFTYIRHEDRFHDWLSDMCLHYRGEPWRMRIVGQADMVVVCTPEGFDAVLASQFPEFPNGDFSNLALSGLFGKSISTLDGPEWYHQRKAAAKFFTARALRQCMLHTMKKNVLQMYETLGTAATTNATVDLTNLLSQFTLQTFAEVGLGIDLRWIGKHEPNPLQHVLDKASPATMRRFRVPAFWWKFEKYMGFGPEKEMMDATHAVRQWLSGIIDRSLDRFAAKRQETLHSKQHDEDAIKSIVELFFEHSQEDQDGLRPEDLVDFMLTFVLAAQETSALTMARFFLLLTQHPHVEARIRNEMQSIFPRLGVTPDTYLTTDHVHHLVYLDATIREVLRLYSTVPLMQKEAGQDTVICGDIPIRKGEQVCLPSYAMARNPDVWGDDAAEFKPDRWIDATTGELLSVSPSKFPAFSAGPRTCIGMKLALMELRVVTANLLRQYRFSLAEPNDGDYVVAITLSLKHPLRVRAQRVMKPSA